MVVNGEMKQLNLAWEDYSDKDYCREKCEFYNTCHSDRETCLKKSFTDVLDTLTDTERAVLKFRFGFCDNKPLSLAEIANCLNLEPEHVRQITAKALRKLRHPSRSRRILSRKSEYLSSNAEPYSKLIIEAFGHED